MMTSYKINSLQQFIQTQRTQIPELADYETQLDEILKQESLQLEKRLQREKGLQLGKRLQPEKSLQREKDLQLVEHLISLYDAVYPLVEKKLWTADNFDEMLEIYQSLFREQESLIKQSDATERYDFILSIPIADRPEHLRACLESIFQLCTLYSYAGSFTDITPARTIYPGNYITTFDGLKYIIPFGQLRLRMSGPTAGRLIQSEIKERFASVNLPMLHARTLQSDFKDEYRPGVEDNIENIDLSDEFERQFFGDLMLFSVVKLSQ